MNLKELEDYFGDWNLQLEEAINDALYTEYGKKFCWETIENFECMVDEITRLHRVVDFHDILAQTSDRKLLDAINNTGEELEDILSEFLDFYISVPLGIKLDKKKIIEKFMEERNNVEKKE